MSLDLIPLRRHFHFLSHLMEGKQIAYLDSAATAQKPQPVLDAMAHFYEEDNGNAHRGMHPLAERATVAFEGARETVRKFVNAKRTEEIVFTKNATESINLVARSWGMASLKRGDIVVLTKLEHHSNIVPWMQLKEMIGIVIEWIDIDDTGRLQLDQLRDVLKTGKAKLLCITGESNVLGVRPNLEEIIPSAHKNGCLVMVDAAQSIVHGPTDVQQLDCDFLAFSGHKLYGPTGIGVLYAKAEILRSMPPFLGGGMMIGDVRLDGFSAADIPHRFEAGTQPMAEAVGLAAAIEWLNTMKWNDIEEHERALLLHAREILQSVPGMKILGPGDAEDVRGCISFAVDGVHAHDLTEILGREGICLRAGHHCAQPLHDRLGIVASNRISFAVFNTTQELDLLPEALTHAIKRLRI